MKPRDDRAGGHGVPRVMASAPSVVQQARLMDAAGTAWHAVKRGNLEMITKLFPVPCNVYARGPVGENVMHVAMLLNTPSTLAITRYLVKLYGRQLVNCPIQERKQQHDPPGTYEGQTALHIAIVNRDFDMVKFLVQNGADIRARAWGTFFRQGGPMYYGEYALSFAACSGQKDIVAYLRRHGAQVNSDCDEFGNTALHMCVIHDQADMYDFLVDYCAASEAVRNHGGLTPLCLAAQLGKADMLQHIYSRRRRAFYSFGKVTSYSLSLREIDTVQDEDEAAGPDGGYVPNALEAVLRKRHLDMLQEPLLTLLLQHKWEKFARTQFVVHFLGYLLLEVSQTILIWLHSSPGMWNGPGRASQEFLGIILALALLAVEVMYFVKPGRASQEFLGIILALALLAVEVLDYVNWSRECYHRRLTMTVHKEVDPPLYPIPGEMRDARDNRQGLFARLSARMGFSATSSGMQQGSSGTWQQRSEGGLGTPRAAAGAAAAAAAAAAAPRGVSHPGTVFGSSPARDAGNASEQAAAAVRPQGAGTAHRLSLGSLGSPKVAQGPQQQQQPPQPPSPPRGAGARRTAAATGSPRTPGTVSSSSAAAAGPPGTPKAAAAAVPGSPSRGSGPQPMSPARSSQQIYRKSHDDPIDLRPKAGNVIGEGASVMQGADGSSSGSPAAAGGGLAAEAAAAAGGRSSARQMSPLLSSSVAPVFANEAAAAMDSSSAAAGGARLSGAAPSSPSFRSSAIPRAKSFQGIGTSGTRAARLTDRALGSEDGGNSSTAKLQMSRAATAGDEMLQSLATCSTPADPLQAVQMLERQRTRARSGGGDLPAALALKRTPASKKERPAAASVFAGRGLAAAGSGDGGADGAGGAGGGGGREAGSLATASTETGSVKVLDMEKGPAIDILDPHKSRLRAMLETTYEGAVRMLEDPWLFIWHLHLLLTCMHFLIWVSSYGWIGGPGPKSMQVREFDDVIVSMMGLSGWLAVIYFFRGLVSTGKLTVLLERCIVDVVKFVGLYVLWNLGFTLAFFTMQNGVLGVAPGSVVRNTESLIELSQTEPDPFSSIGNTMVTLVNLGAGLSHYEYAMTCKNDYVLSSVLCTIYYLLYMATVVLLLMNLLIAMIIKTWGTTQEAAEGYWKHRWAIYVIKAERRLPRAWVQRLRLGQLTYDPVSDKRVHSHVFETVDEDKAADSSKAAVEGQIKAVEQLLEELRKRRGSSS
ncbi:hypothetical protein OEZ85_005527 [Tetradesmus obliquus]|uniref:Ion transport domain-containing protein n=1 Tax=Tetradesmus obliquus TaxID=3088 RepID=A0ABY8UE87_TETOB|nr:hypothetical protein OEZ85_005527 [Tetradesmus obliquus]